MKRIIVVLLTLSAGLMHARSTRQEQQSPTRAQQSTTPAVAPGLSRGLYNVPRLPLPEICKKPSAVARITDLCAVAQKAQDHLDNYTSEYTRNTIESTRNMIADQALAQKQQAYITNALAIASETLKLLCEHQIPKNVLKLDIPFNLTDFDLKLQNICSIMNCKAIGIQYGCAAYSITQPAGESSAFLNKGSAAAEIPLLLDMATRYAIIGITTQ